MSTVVTPPTPFPVWMVPERARVYTGDTLRVAEVVSALSFALDLGSGEAVGHSVKTGLLAMRLADEMGLTAKERQELYYTALLKDAGCSANASLNFHALQSDDLKAKHDVKFTDWTRTNWESLNYAFSHVATGKPFLERARTLLKLAVHQKQHTRRVTQIRCEHGMTIARLIGLPEATAEGIANLDEHWDGAGQPEGLRKQDISILSRITLLCQTLEIFAAGRSREQALEIARQRSRKWFDPEVVKAAESLAARGELWTYHESKSVFSLALDLEPEPRTLQVNDHTFDAICVAFAQIVDAKSPFTFQHSNGVASAAVSIARQMGFKRERILFLRHAALLHDLGKMAVSNEILEKPGNLTEDEYAIVKTHPYYTWKILNSIPRFGEMSEIAASHHEKLNGKGYFRGLSADRLPLEARILTVADIFDALAAKRPYRDAMPLDRVLEILRKDIGHAVDGDCVEALVRSGAGNDQTFLDLHTLNTQLSNANVS